MDNVEKKLLLDGKYENVIEINNHFYLIDKKDKICVLPYTISDEGLLDKIGIVQERNYIEEKDIWVLINDYISTDDKTDLVAANRILFEIIGTNVSDAVRWIFLGKVFSTMNSDSPIKLYAVDITNINIKALEEVEEQLDRKKFKMLDSSKVIQSDDILFLATYLRLWNYFYINSIDK